MTYLTDKETNDALVRENKKMTSDEAMIHTTKFATIKDALRYINMMNFDEIHFLRLRRSTKSENWILTTRDKK